MEKNKQNIAIIGLGYVGLPLAVEFGKKFRTVGFDINKTRVDQLKSGTDITLEVDDKNLKKAENLTYTSNTKEIAKCNFYIITVPTPIDDAKRPNLDPIIKATKIVAENLKNGDFVIYESTVFPGCTEEICVPILEKISGLSFNDNFFCGYSPERVNPGDKINTLTKIKKITSGSTNDAASKIDELYKSIISAGTFMASSIKVAEAAKVIENTQRDLNIALVNELSVIFEKLDIDTLETLEAAGSKWNFLPFRPGLVGGHCIGVDPYYLTHKAEQVGYNPQVILAGRRINDDMARYTVKKVIQKMLRNGIDVSKSKIGVLGVTFKENCPDIRNSKIIDVIDELNNWGAKVVVDDPWADPHELRDLYGIELQEINKENQVDSLIVAVGHKQFRDLSAKQIKNLCRERSAVVADVKSLYDKDDLASLGLSVFRL